MELFVLLGPMRFVNLVDTQMGASKQRPLVRLACAMVVGSALLLVQACGLLPRQNVCDRAQADCEAALAAAIALLPPDVDRSRLIQASIDFIEPGDDPQCPFLASCEPSYAAVAMVTIIYPIGSAEQPFEVFVAQEEPGGPFGPAETGIGPHGQ